MAGTWRDGIRIAAKRRRVLRQHFDIKKMFDQLEESCVPSYCHRNRAAAAVAWLRLLVAGNLWRRYASGGSVLDFGAATGELVHFLGNDVSYHFIDQIDLLADSLFEFIPRAKREVLEDLPEGRFGAVFALDSLEHNEDPSPILDRLLPALRRDGVFILSGPTENSLYRLGRRAARFAGDYHKTTIHDIEQLVEARRFVRLSRSRVPLGVPLFHVSAWRAG